MTMDRLHVINALEHDGRFHRGQPSDNGDTIYEDDAFSHSADSADAARIF
jgi:hypothetical protein